MIIPRCGRSRALIPLSFLSPLDMNRPERVRFNSKARGSVAGGDSHKKRKRSSATQPSETTEDTNATILSGSREDDRRAAIRAEVRCLYIEYIGGLISTSRL